MTVAGSSRSAVIACVCASMLSAARYSSNCAWREVHGPNGISFNSTMSGCARAIRRTNRVHARLSCARPSGNWQMAMFMPLPHAHPRLRFEIQGLAGLHVEGGVPGVEVADRRDAETLGGMIGGGLVAREVFGRAGGWGAGGAA